MREIDLVYRTMFAELIQRGLDASFQSDFPLDGRFVTVPVKGRRYWYFDRPTDGKVTRTYVGPHSDPEITTRVAQFKDLKHDLKARRKLVSTLVREAGLPASERLTGDIVEALAAAGLFRLRGVLVGTVAFQCYAGLIGVRLATAATQTGDVDFAQFHSISAAVDDSLPPVLDVIRAVDPSFREIPHQSDAGHTVAFENRSRFRIEFLTPNRGSADHDGRPAGMPALGGASAQPLRFLDLLIREPVRSVLLHKSGINVTVPAPERFAVHKLIIASRRRSDAIGLAKRSKDVVQAGALIEALGTTRRHADIAAAYVEAWKRGPSWREAIRRGLSYIPQKTAEPVREILVEGFREITEDPAVYKLVSGTPANPIRSGPK